MRKSALLLGVLTTTVASSAYAAPLVIDGAVTTNTCPGGALRDGGRACEYGGTHSFDYVQLIRGAKLYVRDYNGADLANTGNLVLKATGRDPSGSFSVLVDRTSRIVAKGSGYRARSCNDGEGPSTAPLSGGRGGCSVLDGGGGGAHIGGGGRGTKDFNGLATRYEEACGSLNAAGNACIAIPGCRNDDGLPSVAGQAYSHSVFATQLGAAGGDQGCGDGDTFNTSRGGNGGGRLVLFAANAAQTGVVRIEGRISTDGHRGCADGNDPAGGGAGGTVLIVGDSVQVPSTARITAHGGKGGDTAPKCLPCTTNAQCSAGQLCQQVVDPQTGVSQGRCGPCDCTPCTSNAQCDAALGQTCKVIGGNVGQVCADASNQCSPIDPGDNDAECVNTQNNGTCISCGGGGGGGLIEVRSRVADIDARAIFDARGGGGGICPVCVGEAGETSTAVRLGIAYEGEVCDGYDNDFNGIVDDGLPPLQCADGLTIPSCIGGIPQTCPSNPATCTITSAESLPRFAILFGTSGSMLRDVAGNPQFGDGSEDFAGAPTGNPSRMQIAKQALRGALAGADDKSFALARFYQDVGEARFCPSIVNAECAGQGTSYDDPRENVAPTYPTTYPGNLCSMTRAYPLASYPPGPYQNVSIGQPSEDANCINYAGSCGSPRRGAQVLVGFDQPAARYDMWLDGRETAFTETANDVDGAHCIDGDCELRASGERSLASGLQALRDWIRPIVICDANKACRDHSVVVVTDGRDGCDGDAVAAAAELASMGVKTHVIGVGVASADRALLDAVAEAGGTDAGQIDGSAHKAFFGTDQAGVETYLTAIMANEQAPRELCNGLDDNCNGLVDEGFVDVGEACDNGKLGVCRVTSARTCSADGLGTECPVANDPGPEPTDEICNGLDDDCNGEIDDLDDCPPVELPDAGPELPDAAVEDAGEVDAATPDAAVPITDAGMPAPPVDAATTPEDADEDPGRLGGGCSCDAAPSSPAPRAGLGVLSALLGLAWLRRRTTRTSRGGLR